MNVFVADPHWDWWIIAYFFLGGIAAGAYSLSTLIETLGRPEDGELARVGYSVAFPLILVCGVLLVLDLNYPARFWHMLLRSEVVAAAKSDGWPTTAEGWGTIARAPLLKYWSPMSAGSWALTLFGACAAISFWAAAWPLGAVARFHRSLFGLPVRALGCLVGFFVASYTGALLTATNQPIWSDSVWLAPLFLASAASTGAAVLVLFGFGNAAVSTLRRIGRADVCILLLELWVFVMFLSSLGPALLPLLETVSGQALVLGTLFLSLLLPLLLHVALGSTDRAATIVTATFVLAGGLCMRWAILSVPQELARGDVSPAASVRFLSDFGPEAGRRRGQAPANQGEIQPTAITPRSEVFED